MKLVNRPVRLSCATLLLLAIFTLAGQMPRSSFAQSDQPPSGWECSIEPANLVTLLQLIGQMNDVGSEDVLQPIDPIAIVPGEPVDARDLEGLEQTSREIAACVNGRDVLRLVALFTPSFQAKVVVDLLEGEEAESILEDIPIIAAQVDRDQQLIAIPIEAAWYSSFSNHEIDAILAPYVDGLEEQRRFLVRFVYDDGRWLIDNMRLIGSSDALPATPVPTETATAVAAQQSDLATQCWGAAALEEAQAASTMQFDAPPAMVIDESKTYEALLATSMGSIEISMPAGNAPLAVNNFVCLAEAGFYDGSEIFRVLNNYLIQMGMPAGPEYSDAGYLFEDEPFAGDYLEGTVVMANSGPDTNSSQFLILLDDLTDFLPRDYTIFGTVIEGMDVVQTIGEVAVVESNTGEMSWPETMIAIEQVTISETATVATPPPITPFAIGTPDATPAASPEASPVAVDGPDVVLELMDIFFNPDVITIPADADVTIQLANSGSAEHSFFIDELGIDETLAAGQTLIIEINVPAGVYEFECTIPGHKEAGMVGTLIVE